jgi:hypothetical protein
VDHESINGGIGHDLYGNVLIVEGNLRQMRLPKCAACQIDRGDGVKCAYVSGVDSDAFTSRETPVMFRPKATAPGPVRSCLRIWAIFGTRANVFVAAVAIEFEKKMIKLVQPSVSAHAESQRSDFFSREQRVGPMADHQSNRVPAVAVLRRSIWVDFGV